MDTKNALLGLLTEKGVYVLVVMGCLEGLDH
jgi:hypothetical protein